MAQRASRDRKEQHIKSLEARLRQLEERNQTLENAYVNLQERLRRSRWEVDHGIDDAWGLSEEEWPSQGR
jgi:vacuolar-type H+-ATPase subunit E/Vma4